MSVLIKKKKTPTNTLIGFWGKPSKMEKPFSPRPDFTLVLPCYNEGEHILDSIEEIITTLNESKYACEIILIDDKSTDNTKACIFKIIKKHKEIKAYFHSKNEGRGATVAEGIEKAKTNIVGFIDFDLEVSPVYIHHLVSIIKNGEADIAMGHRHYVFHPFNYDDLIREILSRGYSILIKYFLRLPFRDTEAGYKFFNKTEILPILKQTGDRHWFWDTEIIARSYFSGLKIKEVPVLFLRNWGKTSTVHIIPDTIGYLKALINFRKSLKSKP